VLMNAMAENLPMELAGYDLDESLTLGQLERNTKSLDAALLNAPCAADSDTAAEKLKCWQLMRRLAYLNQQSDGGAHKLRGGKVGSSRVVYGRFREREGPESRNVIMKYRPQ
jgi:hypothetical protein